MEEDDGSTKLDAGKSRGRAAAALFIIGLSIIILICDLVGYLGK